MIKLREVETNRFLDFEITKFPDNTSQVWKINPPPEPMTKLEVIWNFENEAEMIRAHSEGILVKIVRDGVGPVNTHSSDSGLPDSMFDLIINNDGSLEEFLQSVEKIASLKSQYVV